MNKKEFQALKKVVESIGGTLTTESGEALRNLRSAFQAKETIRKFGARVIVPAGTPLAEHMHEALGFYEGPTDYVCAVLYTEGRAKFFLERGQDVRLLGAVEDIAYILEKDDDQHEIVVRLLRALSIYSTTPLKSLLLRWREESPDYSIGTDSRTGKYMEIGSMSQEDFLAFTKNVPRSEDRARSRKRAVA